MERRGDGAMERWSELARKRKGEGAKKGEKQ